MTTREEIVAEARTWIDTPYRHQGRLKGVGVDCIGIVRETAAAFEITEFDTTDYSEQPDPDLMGELLREHMDEIPFSEVLPADVVWLLVDRNPRHLAIITEIEPRIMMIHALRRRGRDRSQSKVVEHALDERWEDRVVSCFRFRGI